MKAKLYCTVINHKHGYDCIVHFSEEGAAEWIYGWVVEYWHELGDKDLALTGDAEEDVELYFNEHPHESYSRHEVGFIPAARLKWKRGRAEGGCYYTAGWRGWELDICRWDGGWRLTIAMDRVILWQSRYETLRKAKESAPVCLTAMLWREFKMSAVTLG